MSTWEERMAQRAAAREREPEPERDEHAGHHLHLIGTMVQCSCGTDFGVTCVAFPAEVWESPEQAGRYFDSLSCSVCGKTGLVGLTPPR